LLVFLAFLILASIANYRFIRLTKALIIKLRKLFFKFNPKRAFHVNWFSITIDSVLDNALIKFEKTIETKKGAYPSTKSTPSVSEKRKGVDGAEAN